MQRPSRVVLFQLCFSLGVSIGSCTCKPLTSEDPEGRHWQRSEEGDGNSWTNLLGTMKEGFLRKLNLSEVPQEHSRIDPPQFMMELYHRFASDSSAAPQSDVIRSFTVQDITPSLTNGTQPKYRLQFNVSLPDHEKVNAAELQLFFSLPDAKSSDVSRGFRATVKVYEVTRNGSTSTARLLVGKEVSGSRSAWEMFDVTSAVHGWIESGRRATALDVVVDGKHGSTVSVSVGENTSAALIVFSDDLGSRGRETNKELLEMMVHEEEAMLHAVTDWNAGGQLPNEIREARHPRRQRRKAEREYCRRTSLKVNFKEIGWDSWIVAPSEYDAFECRGLCYHPLTDESTPSKHALIQTLINIRDPKKANMACCVPIKLEPITIMYKENGRVAIRHMYEEMKVAECGCR